MAKLICGLVAAMIPGTAGADDEFVPPTKAEREAVAALVEIGATVQIDAQYRVTTVVMPANCSNADLKLLAGCRDLTHLQLTGNRIREEGLEHLQGLTQLKSITVRSPMSAQETEAWKAALPKVQISAPAIRSPNGFGSGFQPAPASGTSGRRGGFVPSTTGPGGPGGSSGFGTFLPPRTIPLRILVASAAVQDDLKLTPEQRSQIAAATGRTAPAQDMDERLAEVLTAEQKARIKQIELQERDATSQLIRTDIARELKLTQDQLLAIIAVMNEFAPKLRSVISEGSANQASGNSQAALDSRAKLAEVTKERDEKALALLNPDQRKAWQEMIGRPAPKVTALAGISIVPGSAFGGLERVSQSAFLRYDTDGSGTLSESELPDAVKSRLTAAGATLKFPMSSEEFVKAYSANLERGQRGQGRSAIQSACATPKYSRKRSAAMGTCLSLSRKLATTIGTRSEVGIRSSV